MNDVYGAGTAKLPAQATGLRQFNATKFWRIHEIYTGKFRGWRHRALF